MTTATHIGAEKYVSFTSYKRNGDAVSTPVWIISLPNGEVGFTTDVNAWKVKRIANNPRVTLRACDIRGHEKPGAVEVLGNARLVTGQECAVIEKAVTKKYGVLARLVDVSSWVKHKFRRGDNTSGAVSIILD
jgi:PPOX class probable F420-dependent enzyme